MGAGGPMPAAGGAYKSCFFEDTDRLWKLARRMHLYHFLARVFFCSINIQLWCLQVQEIMHFLEKEFVRGDPENLVVHEVM